MEGARGSGMSPPSELRRHPKRSGRGRRFGRERRHGTDPPTAVASAPPQLVQLTVVLEQLERLPGLPADASRVEPELAVGAAEHRRTSPGDWMRNAQHARLVPTPPSGETPVVRKRPHASGATPAGTGWSTTSRRHPGWRTTS